MKGEENNRVIIHIWTSEHNRAIPGEDVGHVSIEIPKLQNPVESGSGYYSLWPDLDLRGNQIGYISPVPGRYMHGYRRPEHTSPMPRDQMPNYDCDAEGREAEINICLYYLDIYKIREKFDAMKAQIDKWVLVGKNILKPRSNNACSCTSLARDLLIAGGIYEFLHSSASFSWSSSPIPDSFVSLIILAKKAEHGLHPITKAYIYPEETSMEGLQIDRFAGLRFLKRSCNLQ